MKEKDLEIYDVWKSPNGNLFIKMCETHSLAIGAKGHHEPNENDSNNSQYVKTSNIPNVKKVGRIVFD